MLSVVLHVWPSCVPTRNFLVESDLLVSLFGPEMLSHCGWALNFPRYWSHRTLDADSESQRISLPGLVADVSAHEHFQRGSNILNLMIGLRNLLSMELF